MPRKSTTLRVGSPAPPFELVTPRGEKFRLGEGLERPLALIFIRGTW